MNIDRQLVARAFAKAGEEPITDEEWTDGTGTRVRTIKEFYHAVILEALASYDWTSQKKRKRLELVDDEVEENLTVYKYMYALPADCAKCVSVNDDEDYIVEGAFLFCDSADAILCYITNYFTGNYKYQVVANPTAEDIDQYYVLDPTDNTYYKAISFIEGMTYYIRLEEDYNFYDEPKLDPLLSQYIELMLAANIALKLTGDNNKFQMLFNESTIIGDKAQKQSSEMARNKSKGNKTWIEQLGLN